MKTWSSNLVDYDLCDGCDHCKCIENYFCKKHNEEKAFYNETYGCYYCMDLIKIKLESYHMSIGLNKQRILIESINCFSSFLNIDFVPDDTNFLKKML